MERAGPADPGATGQGARLAHQSYPAGALQQLSYTAGRTSAPSLGTGTGT